MSISIDELLHTCKTGDLLLFNARNHWYDFIIEYFTGSKFSHVGMIVRDMSCCGKDIDICMLESGYEHKDEIDNKCIYGVQLTDLRSVLEESKNTNETIYYRRLTDCDRTPEFVKITQEAIQSIYDKPYDLLPQDWVKSEFDIHKGNCRRINTFWCSALVTYMYYKYGFVKQSIDWTLIQPTQFSFYEGKQLELINVSLTPEIKVFSS